MYWAGAWTWMGRAEPTVSFADIQTGGCHAYHLPMAPAPFTPHTPGTTLRRLAGQVTARNHAAHSGVSVIKCYTASPVWGANNRLMGQSNSDWKRLILGFLRHCVVPTGPAVGGACHWQQAARRPHRPGCCNSHHLPLPPPHLHQQRVAGPGAAAVGLAKRSGVCKRHVGG